MEVEETFEYCRTKIVGKCEKKFNHTSEHRTIRRSLLGGVHVDRGSRTVLTHCIHRSSNCKSRLQNSKTSVSIWPILTKMLDPSPFDFHFSLISYECSVRAPCPYLGRRGRCTKKTDCDVQCPENLLNLRIGQYFTSTHYVRDEKKTSFHDMKNPCKTRNHQNININRYFSCMLY